jgi:hypothetical protein
MSDDRAKVSVETLVNEIKLQSVERSLAITKLTQIQKLCEKRDENMTNHLKTIYKNVYLTYFA